MGKASKSGDSGDFGDSCESGHFYETSDSDDSGDFGESGDSSESCYFGDLINNRVNLASLNLAYLIFVTGTTGGACVNFFCQV